MLAELGEYRAELEKLQQAFHAAQDTGNTRLSEVIAARIERIAITHSLCEALEDLRALQVRALCDDTLDSALLLLGATLEDLAQNRPSVKLQQYYARTRREAQPRRYDAGSFFHTRLRSCVGVIDTSAHTALWRLCAIALVVCSDGITATHDVSNRLPTLWTEWRDMDEGVRETRCGEVIEQLAQMRAFNPDNVPRWIADLKNESLDADDLMRQEQQALEIQPEARAMAAPSDGPPQTEVPAAKAVPTDGGPPSPPAEEPQPSGSWMPASDCIDKEVPELRDHTPVRRYCEKHKIPTQRRGKRGLDVDRVAFERVRKEIAKSAEKQVDALTETLASVKKYERENGRKAPIE